MEDFNEKLPSFRNIIWILALLIPVELAVLFNAVPVKNFLHYTALATVVIAFIYLITLCLRFLKELQRIHKKD